jgi:xanthine dehydrogenase iron-sulfur cluster and FAD-binding subunit A
VEHGGAQCGICTPGMILAAIALGKSPTLDQMKTGLAGNLCRCTGYAAIYRSIDQANRGINRGVRGGRRVKKTPPSRRRARLTSKKARRNA